MNMAFLITFVFVFVSQNFYMFIFNVNELANSCNVCTIVSNLHKKS
jgi:hypothetical protein